MTARRIPGSECVAETLYRSTDGSVRQYRIVHPTAGTLGCVTYHGARLARSAGYHRGRGSYRGDLDTWPTLAAAAAALLAEVVK